MTKNQFLPPKVRRPREELADAVHTIETLELTVAGSYRREKDTVGDLDILVPYHIDYGETIEDMQNWFGYELVRHGAMKSEGIAQYKGSPLLLNLWRVPEPKAWGGMLLFATGPYDLNIAMRARAKGKGLKLSQYGLFDDEDAVGNGLDQIDGGTEESIFECLGINYLHPVEREDWRPRLLPKKSETGIRILSSKGDDYYMVQVSQDGVATSCECVGFTYRHHCKHMAEAEAKWRSQ